MSYDSEIETVPLVYDSKKDCSTVKQVLLVHDGVPDFLNYANENTFAIQHSRFSSSTDLFQVLRSRFTQIERIGIVQHYNPNPSFIDSHYFFTNSDFTGDGSTMSNGLELLLELLLDFDVQHIDFLGCKTLQYEKWRQFYDILEANTDVVVSASDDNTGNLKYGGDWILENTMTDVKALYFNDLIENFASLLTTHTENYITYTYDSGTGFAKVTDLDTDSVGDFTIPSQITIGGTEYDVNEIGYFRYKSDIHSLTFTGTSIHELSFVYDSFGQCQNLVECNMELLNRDVKFIGANFNRCHSLTTFVFPNNLACNFDIGSFTFQSCSSLHRLDFTATITNIGSYAFRNDLTSTYTYNIDLYFYQTTALPTMGWGDNVAIQNIYYIEGVNTTNIHSNGQSLLAIWAPPVPLNIEPLPPLVNNQYSFTQLSTNDLTQTDIVGSTTAEQKTHLKDILKEIYATYTDLSGYDFILKSGSVLPGYSTSLTTDIGIYNATKSISNSYLDTIQFDTLKDTSFFVLMDLSGDTVTLPSGTENYNITITQISDVSFSITSPIETVIKAVDDSFSYNGLSFTLGSAFGTLVANELPLFPTIPLISHTYYNVFYTVSKSNPSVLNAKFYDQSQTLISTQDISFNGKTMKEILAFLENSAANPYAIGKTRTGFRSMDLTYGAVYKKALKDSQQQSLMTYVNKTFKNVYSSAVTVYDVKVNGFMKYVINDVEQPNLVATQIGTYVFDQSDPSNHGHRLKFRNLSDSTTPYTTNVTHEGPPGTPNSYSIIDVTQSTPDLEYYCENHTESMYGEFKTLTDLTSYRVKVETNVLGDPVFSLSPPGTNEYYNQIDVSFGAGSKILFDVSHYTMADVSFVFGTVVDNSSTIIDSFVTYQDGLVMLDICSGYVGESLKYFEDTTAGMGYVEASLPFTGPAEPELIWLKMDTGDLTGSTLTNHGSDTSIGNATTVNNPSISTIHKKIGTGSIFVDHSNIYSRESINLPIVSLPTNFTVSFWMKLGSNIYPTNSIWWYKNTNDWTSNGLFMKIEASNIGSDSKKLALYVKSSRTLVSSPYSNNQNWNHICLTCGHNGSSNYTIKMYLNNSLLSTTNSTLYSSLSYNYHTLGAALIDGGYFDDYRFYNRVLSSSEINSVYNYVQRPTIHSKVVTVSGDTVVFYIDGSSKPNFTFTSGDTYIFDQSDTTNADNTLVLGTVTDSSVNLIDYQTIVGTPGQPGAYTSFTASSGTVYYFSYQTDNMGGQISI